MALAKPHVNNGVCSQCGHVPRNTPERVREGIERSFDTPLDEGIKDYVLKLLEHGVETDESCEGGPGHAYPEPTVCFVGEFHAGLHALSVALMYRLPVSELRRVWRVIDGEVTGPGWQMTFSSPRPPGQLPWWWKVQRADGQDGP